ncbi:hypothetical protein [Arthrobacter sp. K5]|uniref:Uncharacterized protein n=1 Tax=Arthrobacter sp. K5 TaxID=2839623 RepID=A0AAU8EWK4_9MICC
MKNPPTPTLATAPDPKVMLADIKATIASPNPLVISVLGDSTSNEPGEWVDLYAQHLATIGTVSLHFWDQDKSEWSHTVKTYPGPDRKITIWNGSMVGASQAFAIENAATLVPERPSFVMLNYGHNYVSGGSSATSWRLMSIIDEKWGKTPAAVMLQNPSINARAAYSANSVLELKFWAQRFGYPTVDLQSAFTKAGNLKNLLKNNIDPNPAGSRLWADNVVKVVGP